jgi:glyoxylase-like metal-dependent hydrolase (beta-lactamase superfamily II)
MDHGLTIGAETTVARTGHLVDNGGADRPRDLGQGIYQLPTDYPQLCNAPLWTYLESLCVPEPRVGILLRDGDTLKVGERALDVIETRGHTWGHCALFDNMSGALFTGDAVQGTGVPSRDGQSVFAPLYRSATS